MTRLNADGFSLIELLVVVGLITTLAVSAAMMMPNMVNQSRADSSASVALNNLRLARDRAISDRRNMELVFTAPKHIQVVRDGINGEANSTIIDVYLDSDLTFLSFTGMIDTPDGFGLTNKPIAFGPTVGVTPTLMFTSEGTLVDSTGDTINGTLFLGAPGDTSTARAVTIFGPTALLRQWRWNGKEWVE
jgi:prepilin-type N-terminal cleavage/methylation domain-containing protein